jgi:hypothetical protein
MTVNGVNTSLASVKDRSGGKRTSNNIIECLKREWDGWEESVMIRRQAYLTAKENMRLMENKYRESRSIYNKAYKEWREARIEAERAKRRFKTYPYRIRQWAKQNFGKVWEMIERE